MPTDRNDLAARLARATPDHQMKGGALHSVLAAAERALGKDDAGLAALKARLGRKLKMIELFNYPVADILPVFYDVADLLEPKLGAEAMQYLGRMSVRRFFDSPVGVVAGYSVARRTPIELLAGGPGIYRIRISWAPPVFRRIDERQAVYEFRNELLPPAYHQGVLKEGAEFRGHSVAVHIEQETPFDFDVVAVWDGKDGRK